MPNALRIGLLGPLLLRDEEDRAVHVGGRQLRVLLTLLALDAGRVVPAGSLADEIWPDDPPGNPGNALQTLVSRQAARPTRSRRTTRAANCSPISSAWTLAAAEQVCADAPLPRAGVLPALSGLVDKSIVTAAERPCGEGPRYGMLETVRAYGLERLAEAGKGDRVRDTFAAYYLDLAETGDAQLRGAGQRRWLLELAAEQDNLQAALRWAIARQDGDIAQRLVLALGWYWMLRGQPGEPETLARQALALQPRERSPRMAEARMVCALTAAGPMWEMDGVRPAVTAAIAGLRRVVGSQPDDPSAGRDG